MRMEMGRVRVEGYGWYDLLELWKSIIDESG